MTVSGIAGLLAGDNVVVSPRDPFPAGYLVGQPIARAAKILDVPVFAPALSVNAAYSFTARVLALRP